MQFGIDFSPQYVGGTLTPALLTSLRNRFGFRRAVVACADPVGYSSCADAVLRAGWELEAYLYQPNAVDWPAGIRGCAPQLAQFPPRRLWLDLEDVAPPLPDGGRIQLALAAAGGLDLVLPPGIYSAAWYWQLLSSVDVSALAPLWSASYTRVPPDANTGFNVAYGGWYRAAAVQYAGDVGLLGLNVDLDAWDS